MDYSQQLLADIVVNTKGYSIERGLPVPNLSKYMISAVIGDGSLVSKSFIAEDRQTALSKFFKVVEVPEEAYKAFSFTIIKVNL